MTVTDVGLKKDGISDALQQPSHQLGCSRQIFNACSELRRTSFRCGLHPSRVCGELRCTSADNACRSAVAVAPAPMFEYIAPAPINEHIAQAPAVSCVAPASEVYATQAPLFEHITPAPVTSTSRLHPLCQAPAVYATPDPKFRFNVPAPAPAAFFNSIRIEEEVTAPSPLNELATSVARTCPTPCLASDPDSRQHVPPTSCL